MEQNNKIIIGICGKARSGKDTSAAFLKNLFNFKHDSFAAPIRAFVEAQTGISLQDQNNLNNEFIESLFMTLRSFKQTLGTDLIRNNINEDFFIKGLVERNNKTEKLVVSDIRFKNELQAITDMINQNHGCTILIRRYEADMYSSAKEANHQSENDIDYNDLSQFDYVIDNDGTIDNLLTKIYNIIQLENLKIKTNSLLVKKV